MLKSTPTHADTGIVDGIRIDTAKHMGKPFLSSFASAAGVYSLGEVYHASPAYICPYQSHIDGALNYAMYYPHIMPPTLLTSSGIMLSRRLSSLRKAVS
jgi:glycosidase